MASGQKEKQATVHSGGHSSEEPAGQCSDPSLHRGTAGRRPASAGQGAVQCRAAAPPRPNGAGRPQAKRSRASLRTQAADAHADVQGTGGGGGAQAPVVRQEPRPGSQSRRAAPIGHESAADRRDVRRLDVAEGSAGRSLTEKKNRILSLMDRPGNRGKPATPRHAQSHLWVLNVRPAQAFHRCWEMRQVERSGHRGSFYQCGIHGQDANVHRPRCKCEPPPAHHGLFGQRTAAVGVGGGPV